MHDADYIRATEYPVLSIPTIKIAERQLQDGGTFDVVPVPILPQDVLFHFFFFPMNPDSPFLCHLFLLFAFVSLDIYTLIIPDIILPPF